MNIHRVPRYCLARRKLLRILCGFLIVGALYGMIRSNSRNPQERIAHDAERINEFTGIGEILDRVETEMIRNQQKTTTSTATRINTTTTNHSITEKMDKHSWSILDQLDQAKLSYSFGAKRFDGLRTLEWNDCVDEGFRDSRLPPTDPGESFTWQHIDPEDNDIYLFSAFFDVRSTPPQVTVLGIGRNYFFRRRILCRVWYRGQSEPDVVVSSYAFSPETHALR